MTTHTSRSAPTVGIVSTYPPTTCGLATFSFSLRRAMCQGRGSDSGMPVVSVVDTMSDIRSEVIHQHLNGDPDSLASAVDKLNSCDVVLIQHEYGIYGGADGAEVLDLIEGLSVPTIVTLHTIPHNPTAGQKAILESIVATTDQTIVMSNAASLRLVSRYDLDPSKVRIIPHGANPDLAGPRLVKSGRPLVLSWGLIGPGKGLETAIAAFAQLSDVTPRPRYVILGDTHPKVKATQGDSYLEGLAAQAEEAGVSDIVEFDHRYLDSESLIEMIHSVDFILVPYDSREQATSGVLVEAIAAGKPVVATAFPHAVEILATGAGIVVPQKDPVEMAAAMRRLFTDVNLAEQMAATATSIGATMYWPTVAASYEALVSELARERVHAGHGAESADITRIA